MAILFKTERHETATFLEALEYAQTGDRIDIGPAPENIAEAVTCQPHMSGVLSTIRTNGVGTEESVERVFLNEIFLGNNDTEETHGKHYPFYENVLLHQQKVEDAGTVHKFYLIRPTVPQNTRKNKEIVRKPAFCVKAENLLVIPLPSGKGLILIIEDYGHQKILLLKQKRFLGATLSSLSAKNVPVVCNGPHVLCVETPSSVISAIEMVDGGMPIIRYYRGHGRHRVQVYDHPGTTPPPRIWGTDFDFLIKDRSGAVVSVMNGRVVYPDTSGELFITSNALVERKGNTVKANGVTVSTTFVGDMILSHPDGLLYVHDGHFEMLVIKGVPS